jgi:hypothetical protein
VSPKKTKWNNIHTIYKENKCNVVHAATDREQWQRDNFEQPKSVKMENLYPDIRIKEEVNGIHPYF